MRCFMMQRPCRLAEILPESLSDEEAIASAGWTRVWLPRRACDRLLERHGGLTRS
jgi:hypothetical protein